MSLVKDVTKLPPCARNDPDLEIHLPAVLRLLTDLCPEDDMAATIHTTAQVKYIYAFSRTEQRPRPTYDITPLSDGTYLSFANHRDGNRAYLGDTPVQSLKQAVQDAA